jgi:uncharacterized protein
MRCPICKKEATFEGNPYRPFCSERCKLIDLDNWLEGRYRVPDLPGQSQSQREGRAEDGIDEDERG